MVRPSRVTIRESSPVTNGSVFRIPLSKRNHYIKGGRCHNRKGERTVTNLFTGLWHCGADGSTMTVSHKGKGKIFATCAEGERRGGERHYCNYGAFEQEFLRWIVEVKLENEKPSDRTAEIDGRLSGVQRDIADTKARIEQRRQNGSLGNQTLIEYLDELGEMKSKLLAELEVERARNVLVPVTAAQQETESLVAKMAHATGDERVMLRERIAASIRRLVSDVRVWMQGEPRKRLVLVDVEFRDGKHRHFAYRADLPDLFVGMKAGEFPTGRVANGKRQKITVDVMINGEGRQHSLRLPNACDPVTVGLVWRRLLEAATDAP